ncbi:MAG TPA: hypothetical protein VKB80_11545 [Kofleriaceae bacterium]|nr:hypothetical protein [Kofleriaceae bacterium]
MRRIALLVALALLAGSASLVGCRKREDRPGAGAREAGPPPIGADEAERGRKACQGYVDKVCECALEVADLSSECELARSRPGALDLNIRAAAAAGNATLRDRIAVQNNARAIARACIEDTAALARRGCASGAPVTAPATPAAR